MKAALGVLFISILFLLAMIGALNGHLAHGNPVILPISDLLLESPQNKTYAQNFVQVSLSYSIPNEPVNDHSSMQTSVSYLLDGLSVPVSEYQLASNKLPSSIAYSINFQIGDLPDGSHTLLVYVSATADTGFTTFAAESQPITFTTNTLTPTAEPSPASLGIIIAASIIIATLALVVAILTKLLVYNKKLKRGAEPS